LTIKEIGASKTRRLAGVGVSDGGKGNGSGLSPQPISASNSATTGNTRTVKKPGSDRIMALLSPFGGDRVSPSNRVAGGMAIAIVT
jgi:hypothetical protein